MELSYDPGLPLLGVYPKKVRSLSGREICTLVFITALFAIAERWKPPQGP